MITILELLVAILGLVGGSVLGYLARQTIARQQVGTIEAKLEKLTTQARQGAKETVLKAKEQANNLLEEVKKEEKERRTQLRGVEQKLERKEQFLDHKTAELENQVKTLQVKSEKIRGLEAEILKVRDEELKKLEDVSHLSQDEAKKEILSLVEKDHQE